VSPERLDLRRAPRWLARRAGAALTGAALVALACSACSAASAASAAPGQHPSGRAASGAPPLRVLTPAASTTTGDIFLAPRGGGYRSGPEIVTPAGQVVWFHPLPAGQYATDFRAQTYDGQRVLTWFQSGGPHGPQDVIDNDHFQQIAVVHAGDGATTGFHEFLITPWNTALITATKTGRANLTGLGGPADQKVTNGIVQEISLKTGKVLFQWNSAAHVPYKDSHVPRPASANTAWDWFHLNAVHLDTSQDLLINSRFTWTTYKVSLATGKIIWELGGQQSTFRLQAAKGQVLDRAGEIFAFQHDPEAVGPDEYTVFDDESDGPVTLLSHSRVVTIRLDPAEGVATLIKSVSQPEGLLAGAEGNAQTLSNGDLFVGWGALPYVSEFSAAGKLLFNAELPHGVTSYRAYLLAWPPAA
jgi:hypothetical protein